MIHGSAVRKVYVGILGGFLFIIGLIAIPYPGPGFLIVFLALGILGTEFVWARRLLYRVRNVYNHSIEWLSRQPVYTKILTTMVTFVIVVLTVYIFNGYGILNHILSLNQDWLRSPLPIFR